MAEELKACPCCHQPASPAGLKHAGCMNADCMLSGMWFKWDIWQNKRAQLPSQGGEAVEIEYPTYHAQGMGCGLEDRGITDRYEAMAYGFQGAVDQMAAIIDSIGPLYTRPADQVADDLTMVKVSRELLERLCPVTAADGWQEWNTATAYEAAKELRQLLAKSEGVKK